MAEQKKQKIEKKAFGVLQEALFDIGSDGSYSVRELAKEGMTTLKKHATELAVICTKSSVEDVTSLLEKNDIPHDKVVKLEVSPDYVLTGDEQGVSVYNWEGALDNIGWKVRHHKSAEPENKQKRADKSFSQWFDRQVEACCAG